MCLFDMKALDELVKGDVETMKNVIKKDEMNRYSYIMLGTIGAMVIFDWTCYKVFWYDRTSNSFTFLGNLYVGGFKMRKLRGKKH